MWIVFALLASILWGLDYAIAEKVLKKVSVITVLSFEFLSAAIFFLAVALTGQSTFKKDIETLTNSPSTAFLLLIMIVLYCAANVLICISIKSSNASWASLIEVTYPLFVILFSWMLFKNSHLNPATIIGGLLIFCGVGVISYFNR